MKPARTPLSIPDPEMSEDDIRAYAHHLYCQSGCLPGRDLENWLEAEACLRAHIPQEHSRLRLHRHLNGDKAARPGDPAHLAA